MSANRRMGFTITNVPKAGDGTYPVATTNAGRPGGPMDRSCIFRLQGAAAVSQVGVAGSRIGFAWCGACNNVIDITPDAGKHWWQAYMPAQVLSLVGSPNARDGLIAVVEGPTTAPDGRGASLWDHTSIQRTPLGGDRA